MASTRSETRKEAVLPTVLITGASRGIGRNIAVNLALSQKYKLVLLSRNTSKLQETMQLCKAGNNNVQILAMKCDINNVKELKQCIKRCGEEFGPYAVLINNAGITYPHLVDEQMKDEEINRVVNTNLSNLIIACKESVPYLKRTKKEYPDMTVAVIQISSRAATFRATDPYDSVYCASKFGVRGFSDVLFKELKNDGIKICQLMPGWVNTEFAHKYADKLWLKNMIQPSDISYAVNFVLNCPETCCPLEILIYPQYNVNKTQSKL